MFKCPVCGDYSNSAASLESHAAWKHGRRIRAENYRAPSHDMTPSSTGDALVGLAVGYALSSMFDSSSSDYSSSSSDWSGGGGDSGGGGASGDW
ncbi:hypothetical protein [Xanthomonas phage X1]|nr:hypothetical protein [Xanthomonas phage X1]